MPATVPSSASPTTPARNSASWELASRVASPIASHNGRAGDELSWNILTVTHSHLIMA